MLNDLRYAIRTLAKRPLFVGVVVLTLALGIGANSAVFAVVNAALLAPAHVREPERLLNVYTTDSARGALGAVSYPDYVDLRDNVRAFSDVIGYSGLMATVTGGGDPEVTFGELVTGNYFAATGARLALGRGFLAEEDRTPGTHPVVVLGHRLWQRRFSADSNVIGRSIMLNGMPYTIVGVAAQEFQGLLIRGVAADLWAPAMMMGQLRTDQLANRDERWMFVKGRLAPGASEAEARAALSTLGTRLAATYPATNAGRTFASRPMTDVMVHPDSDRVVFPGALALLVTVGFILLIACTNLANMMLARATARRREIAVRFALGMSRSRLLRQLLSESLLLAALGGLAGVLVALWLAKLLVSFHPPLPVPITLDVGIDARVVAYSVLLSLIASLVVGLAPALQASRADIRSELAASSTILDRRSRWLRLRNAFLIPQLALSLALLIVAGLFTRSVGRADDLDPGFDVRHTALVALNLRLDGYDNARSQTFYYELRRRIGALPGVQSTTVTDRIPLDLYGNQTTTIGVAAGGGGQGDETHSIQIARIDARYFDAFGIALVRGRAFSDDEVRLGAALAIVSEEAAQRYWPGRDAIGQQLREGSDVVEVVGVARNVKIQTLGEDSQPFVYRPASVGLSRLLRVVVRTSGNASELVPLLRREVANIDPDVAIFESKTMTEHVDVMLFPYRIAAGVSSVLGLFGLLLASIGLYGVVAFGIARRTREFGIRMALGARPRDVVRMIMSDSGRVVAAGLGIGLALAFALAQILAGVLFGIGPTDPITFVGISLMLIVVAALASWIPARRATQVHPGVALRDD
jgi:predicted permease